VIQRRPSFSATAAVVPLPQKQSRTRSPGLTEDYRGIIEPLQIRIQPPAPGIAVSFLFQDARLLHEARRGGVFVVRGFGDRRGEGEVRAYVEGRVDVDEVHFSGELVEQGGEHVLLVAPDQAVAPLRRAARREHVEHHLPLLRALVHRLHRLEGELEAQRGYLSAAGVVFAGPGEFDHYGAPCMHGLGLRLQSEGSIA